MAVARRRRVCVVDDGDDPDLYDPKYPGQRVIRDGKGIRVPVFLTDAMSPDQRAAISRGSMLFDARNHQPHYAVVDASDPNVRAAERAYYERNAWLQDAWRGPDNPPPPDPEPDEDPRDAYIRRVSNAWKTLPDRPARDPDDDDDPKAAATAVEAQRRRWNAESPAKDAAVADRDVAYGEYIHRLTTAWKRP